MSLEVTISDIREGNRPILNPDGTVTLDSIDFSSVDMYLRCPEQWRRRYILGERKPPGVALLEGTAHHTSMESDNKEKLKAGKCLTALKLTEIFVTKFREEKKRAVKEHSLQKSKLNWENETEKGVIDRAKKLHIQYVDKHSRVVEPVTVEETFSKDVDISGVKFRLHGQIDVTSKSVAFDYKTSGKAKSQSDLDNNLQLTAYSWAKNFTDVSWIAFVKTQDPYIQVLHSKRFPGHWLWGLEVIASAVDGIRRGSFPKTNPGMFPPPWWCSEKFCGYWKTCRGKYDA